jgi:hypothetical protein
MKIRTILRSTAALSIVLVVAVGSALLAAAIHVEDRNREAAIAVAIVNSVTELKIVADEYLMYPSERPLLQWKSKYDSTTKYIAENAKAFHTASERATLSRIVQNLNRFRDIIDAVSIGAEQREDLGEQRRPLSPELQHRLMAEVVVKSQGAIAPAFQLQRMIQEELMTTLGQTSYLVAAAFVALVLMILMASVWISRRVG